MLNQQRYRQLWSQPRPNLDTIQHGQQVVFIAPVYNYRPTIVASLLDQTHQDWKLLLLHDGPNNKNIFDVGKYVDSCADDRIIYHETKVRQQQYGHPLRKMALEKLKSKEWCPEAEYVVVTNADNYHCPPFCSKLLSGFDVNIVMVYCQQMVHNYIAHGIMPIIFKLGHIDVAACMVRKHYACEIGWQDMNHSSDWTYMQAIQQKFGNMNGRQIGNFKQVPGCLLVHN